MWTSSITLTNKEALVNKLANKHKISFFGYPLNSEIKNSEFHVTFYGWTNASITKTKLFFRDLEEDDSIIKAEHHGQSIIMTIKQPKETIHLYTADIIYLQPIQLSTDFKQTYTIGSWKHESLSKILQTKIPNAKLKLNHINQKPIETIGLFSPTNLTEKQNTAFNLAKENGYYDFPKRKTHLKELSKGMNVSIATFQAHLRKAEKKNSEQLQIPSIEPYSVRFLKRTNFL